MNRNCNRQTDNWTQNFFIDARLGKLCFAPIEDIEPYRQRSGKIAALRRSGYYFNQTHGTLPASFHVEE